MKHRCKFNILLFAYFCLIIPTVLCAQKSSSWRHQGRLQVGIENDNNIKESAENSIDARSLRVMFHYTGKKLFSKNGQLKLKYQGAYQDYLGHADENKLISELYGETSHRLSQRWQIGFSGRGRFKIFLNEDIDYSLGNMTLFTDFILFARLNTRLSAIYESLDYAASEIFDHRDWIINLRVNRPVISWCALSSTITYHEKKYNRRAFSYNVTDITWYPTHESQIDQIISAGLQIEIRTSFLANISYTFDKNRSNSYGFSYNRHRMQAIIGMRLPAKLLLRLFAALQQKRYADDLAPFIPLELDTEKEESNFVVIDFSRQIIENITGIVRTAWFDNESPLRSLYYNKFTISFTLEYKF